MIESEQESAYEEALAWLHSARGLGKKEGLSGIKSLLEKLGNPQKSLNIVHVVGTNGKGSTSTMIASILRKSGLRTGLYLSPFIDDFRERLQVDGALISKEDFVCFIQKLKAILPKILEEGGNYPSEFELLTALALSYYHEKDCDAVVLEAGIGGRVDATNAIDAPLVTVITTISLDHTDQLGKTIAEIANEKCGVIKPKTHVVTCPAQNEEALEVIRRVALEQAVSLRIPSMPDAGAYQGTLAGSQLVYRGLHLEIPLAGQYQIQNTVTAIEAAFALQAAGLPITAESMVEGVREAKFHGRLEIVSKHPLFLVDGSHNPQGVDALGDYIDSYLQGYRKIILLGMLRDKNYKACISKIARRADLLITVEADTFRSLSAQEVAELSQGFCKEILVGGRMPSALPLALKNYQENSCILVSGSLYLPGQAKRVFAEQNFHGKSLSERE